MNLLFMMKSGKNLHKLSQEPLVNMTSAHLSNVTDQWVKEGVITKKKIGREIEIGLTETGLVIVEMIKALEEVITKLLNKMKEGETNE